MPRHQRPLRLRPTPEPPSSPPPSTIRKGDKPMANYPPPYPPPGAPGGPPYGNDWKYQRRMLKDQARAQRDMFRAQRDAYRYRARSLRRSSILGPLVLISIGVIFLLIQTGHLQGYRFWEWYSRFWPFLLVGAGVI